MDRVIALVILAICLVYGYTAFFIMDATLPPFMQRNPIWPSTFPKVLAVMGILVSLFIALGLEKSPVRTASEIDIDLKRLREYKVGQAAALLALMVAYALGLRPLGFLLSTALFLILGSVILGERKFHIMIPVSVVTSIGVWYLVQGVLGIFLRPWPFFIGQG